MDLIATRELARIQSLLHLLRAQRGELSELSDIQAFRALEERFQENLEEARSRGKAPADPVAVVRADWERLVAWSNRVQGALSAADALGSDLEAVGPAPEVGMGQKMGEPISRPTISELQQRSSALWGAPEALKQALKVGRGELRDEDWSNGRPYP